jgi:hypothetical protein
MQAAYLRYLGIARELGASTLVSATGPGATTLTLISATGFAATSKVTIYDTTNPALTEVVTATALAGNVLTVGATANAHAAGCLVTTVGTTSAGPQAFFPVTKFDPKDDLARFPDAGWRGYSIDNVNVIDGPRSSEFSMSGDVFPDTIGYAASMLLGDVAFTGGTPNTHKLAAKNNGTAQGSSYQITDVYLPSVASGALVRQYPRCKGSDFTLNFAGESGLTFDLSGAGFASGLVAAPTRAFSSLVPLPSWAGVVSVNGAVTNQVTDGSIEWKRNAAAVPNLDGSPNPYDIWQGIISSAIKLTAIAEDETWLNYYLNNTQPSLDINFSTGAGATLLSVNPHFSAIAFQGAPPDMKDYMTFDMDAIGVGSTSDAGPSGGASLGSLTLKNAVATGAYG